MGQYLKLHAYDEFEHATLSFSLSLCVFLSARSKNYYLEGSHAALLTFPGRLFLFLQFRRADRKNKTTREVLARVADNQWEPE